MIIEGIALTARRLPRFTYLTNVGTTDILADANRRRLRLITGDPHSTTETAWIGCIKRALTPTSPVINVVVMAINQYHPIDEIDIETHGDLVKEAFTFVPTTPTNVAGCLEFYS